jgi:hypothetical protein
MQPYGYTKANLVEQRQGVGTPAGAS